MLLAEREESTQMEGQKAPVRITVPQLQQKQLSFCDGSLDGFEAWAKALPMANVGASAKLLFQATREMNITAMPNGHRFKMLEMIRDKVYAICDLLGKRFLNQSVLLADNDLKIANLTQTLQAQLATGYKRIVLDELALSIKHQQPVQKVMTLALHRAMADLNQTILRAFQLYCQPPKNAWQELHQLFLLADSKNLSGYIVKDDQCKFLSSSSIKDVYTRILLLGCSKPNQLRQSELASLYHATELWCSRARITKADDPHALFVFAVHSDTPPIYKKLHKDAPRHLLRALDTHGLVNALQQALANKDQAATIPSTVNETLVSHLIHSWGVLVERAFRRLPNTGDIEVGIGLVSSHFFTANEKSFPFLMQTWSPNGNRTEKEKRQKATANDVWAQSFDAGGGKAVDADSIEFDSIAFLTKHTEAEQPDTGPKGTRHPCNIVNTSPGGYCIGLNHPPSTVQTGELVVVREARMNHWSVGMIRWIRSMKQTGTQLGIELLAPHAKAVAVRILNKTGDNGEYMRGLLLPALSAAGQSETLIVPILPFKTGAKIELMDEAGPIKMHLLQRLVSSRSFAQYSFRHLSRGMSPHTSDQSTGDSDDEFSSIWDKL